MVRGKRKTVDLSWFDFTPEVLVWGQIKRVLRRYKLSAQSFKSWARYKPRPILEYDNGDLCQGYLSSDLKRFLKVTLQ